MISDLLSLMMPDNNEITFHRWFNAWSEQYHRLPDDQKQANMAVLVEQVVDNARGVLKFNNMIENFDIWRQDNPQNTDSQALDWLRRRFTQLTDQSRSQFTLSEHLEAAKDTLRGPGGKDAGDTPCKYYLQGQRNQGAQCQYRHDPADLKKRNKGKAPAAPATQANTPPPRDRFNRGKKGKGR